MTFLSQLNWRYATKKFDTNRKVSDTDLEKVLEAIRLAPTSFGLQPYHISVVSNADLKSQIQSVGWNQPQFTTASHLLVFSYRTDLDTVREEFFTLMSGGDASVREKLKGYEDMVAGGISMHEGMGTATHWAARQAYIALGFALAATAELEIDSCPMEGFDPNAVNTILSLPENQKSVVILPIGYRDPSESPRPKVRFSREVLFTEMK